MPNVVAIASESAQAPSPTVRSRTIRRNAFWGAICGTASRLLIPTLGWRSVFYVGGLLPLVIGVLSIKTLPESVRFLSARGAGSDRIAKIMAQISPEFAASPVALTPNREPVRKGGAVKHLFTEGRAAGTILLWIPFFMNLLILYFVVNWLPALLRESGMSVANGVTATALFSLGGIVGSVAEGPLMSMMAASWLLVVEFGLCAVLMGLLGLITSSFLLVGVVAFLLGLFSST